MPHPCTTHASDSAHQTGFSNRPAVTLAQTDHRELAAHRPRRDSSTQQFGLGARWYGDGGRLTSALARGFCAASGLGAFGMSAACKDGSQVTLLAEASADHVRCGCGRCRRPAASFQPGAVAGRTRLALSCWPGCGASSKRVGVGRRSGRSQGESSGETRESPQQPAAVVYHCGLINSSGNLAEAWCLAFRPSKLRTAQQPAQRAGPLPDITRTI